MSKRNYFLTVASLLAVGAAMASSYEMPDSGAGNPGNLPLTQTREGAQNVVSLLEKNQKAHAADESTWFCNPSVFTEYTYTSTRDRRLGGFETDAREGTVGLNFMTYCDVAMSLMVKGGGSASDTTSPGHIVNNAKNDGLTLTAAKNWNWFLAGVSGSYNGDESRTRTPIGNHYKINADGLTVAPFIGAMYVNGDFSFSSLPTYMYSWTKNDFDSTGPTSGDDHNNQETFVWQNTANYNVCENLGLGFIANWNRVTHYKKTLSVPTVMGDREWVTLGPKVSYNFSKALSTYASITKDLNSGTFASWQANVGLNYNF